jgi:integrase
MSEVWRHNGWFGWSHIYEAFVTDEQWHTDAVLLPDVYDSVFWKVLGIIHKESPELFSPDLQLKQNPETCPIIKKGVLQKILITIQNRIKGDTFLIRYRLLQVVDAGNHQGLFVAIIPYLSAPPPPAAQSPFLHNSFEHSMVVQRLRQKFIVSISKISPVDDSAVLGRIFMSAMLFGGMVVTKWLLLIPEAVLHSQRDPLIRWLELPLKKGEGTGNRFLTRRWMPDPLTRNLMARDSNRIPIIECLGRGRVDQRLKRAISSYAELAGIDVQVLSNLKELQLGVRTMMQTLIPPYLVNYAVDRYSSTSLSATVWARFVDNQALPELDEERAILDASSPDTVEEQTSDHTAEEMTPAQFRELVSVIRKGDKELNMRVKRWRESQFFELRSVDCISEWVVDWLLVKGKHGNNSLRWRRIYELLRTMGSRLVGSIGDEDPTCLETGALIELYGTILDEIDSTSDRNTAALGLSSWHRFLVWRYQVDNLEGEGVFSVSGTVTAQVDANLLSPTQFRAMQSWLQSEALIRQSDPLIAQSLPLIPALGFFLGMRRSEVIGLQVRDVVGDQTLYVHVRPNGIRSLKSKNSERMIPASLLMPEDQQQALLHWVRARRDGSGEDGYLFPFLLSNGKIVDNDRRIGWMREALEKVTNDPEVRFHHLRHSFANWMLIRFACHELKMTGQELPKWFLPNREDRESLLKPVQTIREELLGKAVTNRRSLMQISGLMGHLSSVTTLNSYVHLLDLLLSIYIRRLTPDLDGKTITLFLNGHPYIHDDGLPVDEALAPRLYVAKLLDQSSDSLLGGQLLKQHTRRSVQHRIRPDEKLEIISRALYFLEKESVQAVSERFTVSSSKLERWQKKVRELRSGIGQATMMKNRYMPEINGPLGFSRGKKQRLLSGIVAKKLDVLRKNGDHNLKPQASKKKISKVLGLFVEHWVPGTAITVRFTRIADAKVWLWLLEKIELTSGVTIQVQPYDEGAQTANQQLRYWQEKLGYKIKQRRRGIRALNKKHHPKGECEIRVTSSAVNPDYRYRSGKSFEVVRLALVAEWIDD